MSQYEKDVTFFAVWLLNCIAESWGCSVREAYETLQRASIVDEYVLPLYDVLHTMGREALVDEIALVARKRGVLV